MGYTKLFSEILLSTVWREPNHVRIVWITMLALRDKYHTVQASIPGLADAAKVTLDECKDALEHLSSPDPYSRSKESEGRRIEPCEGGWYIINAEKYRNKMTLDERNEYQRIKQREYRKKKKETFTDSFTKESTEVNDLYSRAEHSKRKEEKSKSNKKKNPPISPQGDGKILKPDSVSQQTWDDFNSLRNKKKSPLTVTALEGIIREAEKADITLEEALRECCSRGWQGFKAGWITNTKQEGYYS